MNKYLSRYALYYPSTLLKGELVFKYLSQYQKFQWMDSEQISIYQLKRIKAIIQHAYKYSSYYRFLYDNVGIKWQDIKFFDDIKKLPTITKSELIDNKKDITTRWKYISGTKTTGGSTGQTVQVKKNPNALARERAATWRAYEWAGIRVGDPQARFWGVPHSASGRVKALITDFIANRLRLSAFDLTDISLDLYYNKIIRFSPSYLYGYVSAIRMLADYIKRKGLHRISSLKCIITTSEVLTDNTAREIGEIFGCKVFNEYGCGEVGSIAHECEYGSLHIMADNLLVEIDSLKGDSGEIIVTDFYNLASPLIRYRLGDYAMAGNEACGCGRRLPLIKSVHGRAYDLIRTPSGRVIHPEAAMYVFESMQAETGAFKQFQAIQVALNEILVKIIPSNNWNDDSTSRLVRSLKSDLDSEINYRVEICNVIPREKSGKMRLIKSMLN